MSTPTAPPAAEAPTAAASAEVPGGALRVAELDGLRGIAVLLVVLFHAGGIANGGTLGPLRGVIGAFWSGVDLFFVLSGFLITGILLRETGRPGWAARFWWRRLLRILPLYFAVLLLTLLPRWLSGQLVHPPWVYLTFVANHYLARAADGPTLGLLWSLSVEEQFYVAWPWIVALLPRRLLWGPIILGILGSPVLRYLYWPDDDGAFMHTLCRADALMWGAAVALLVEQRHCRAVRVLASLWPVLIGGFFVLAYQVMLRPYTFFCVVPGLSLLALTAASLLCRALLGARPLRQGWLMALGTVSYGIYLLHQVVLTALHTVLPGSGWRYPFFAAAAVLLSYGAAWLSYRHLERPFLALKERPFLRRDRSWPPTA